MKKQHTYTISVKVSVLAESAGDALQEIEGRIRGGYRAPITDPNMVVFRGANIEKE